MQRNLEAVHSCPVPVIGGTATETTFSASGPALYRPPTQEQSHSGPT